MDDNPFAFDSGPRERRPARPPQPPRPAAAGGSALPWVLGGVGALVVVASVTVAVVLALSWGRDDQPPAGAGSETAARGKTEEKKTEAPPDGELSPDLVKRARDAMAYIDLRDDQGHHERGAAFLMGDDLMVGFDPIDGMHKLAGARQYTELSFNPEDRRHSQEHVHFYEGVTKGRWYVIVRNPNKAPPLPLAEADPSEDDEVSVLGYTGGPGTRPTFQVARARVGSRVLTEGTDYSYDLDFTPPAGFVFGGPALDRQGRAVGVVLPPEPGKKTASLFPVDWVRRLYEVRKESFDRLRKGPQLTLAKPPPPPEPPAAWETGGLDAAVFLRVKDGLAEVTAADSGFIVNWDSATFISPDQVLTRGKVNVGRRNGFVYKKLDYTVLEASEGRAVGGGKPRVELDDDVLNITVFRVEAKTRKPGLELSPDEAKVGDKLWVLGKWQLPPGAPSKNRPFSARPTKVVSVAGAKGNSPVVELDFSLPKGEDGRFGGPVVDAKGRVVGVVLRIGRDEKTARMVPAAAIRKVLQEKKLLE